MSIEYGTMAPTALVSVNKTNKKNNKNNRNNNNNHTWKKFLALLAAHGKYSFSSDTFGIIFSQSV